MLRTTIRVKLRRLVTSGWLSLTMIIGIIAAPAYAQQLITNGGFEAGSFAGWTIDNSADSATPGGFYIGNNVSDPALMPHSPSTPLEEFPSVGAASGNYYAVSDDSGRGRTFCCRTSTFRRIPGTSSSRLTCSLMIGMGRAP